MGEEPLWYHRKSGSPKKHGPSRSIGAPLKADNYPVAPSCRVRRHLLFVLEDGTFWDWLGPPKRHPPIVCRFLPFGLGRKSRFAFDSCLLRSASWINPRAFRSRLESMRWLTTTRTTSPAARGNICGGSALPRTGRGQFGGECSKAN